MMSPTAAVGSRSASALVLCIAVFMISSLFTSVNAIKCYQCNTHLNASCGALSIPKAVKSDEFLKECDIGGEQAFCRKTTVKVEHSQEERTVRSCGWIQKENISDHCLNADNEGFLENVCVCYTDGCNSAPLRTGSFSLLNFIVPLIIAALLKLH